jgi:catechol 2,3-dioxygenase-like lactoylglutathione lyase family enzyme
MTSVLGIHHVTAIAGDPQRNLDFYAGVLGLRLVKRTVNFDDPGSYHLYYGDETGRPGSLLTFFPWPGARRGRQGTGQVSVTSFSIPVSSIGYWVERLVRSSVPFEGPSRRLREQVLSLNDPDGMLIELVADDAGDSRPPWGGGPVPGEHAIHGVHSVTLWTDGAAETERALVETLGLGRVAEGEGRRRFAVGHGTPGQIVDVRDVPGFWRGVVAVGTVHHVAFRASDDAHEEALATQVRDGGLRITDQIDRTYFRSMYFNEPGGVLFELATDAPGFLIDEPADRLGETLALPPWLEARRPAIEGALPPLRLATAAAPAR